jgi:hypothetical protein
MYNVEYRELVDEINLVQMALEDTEKIPLTDKTLQEKERLERRVLDYEQHLRLLSKQIEFYENKVG